ncbi:MAG TPA: SRPBCC family protein [Streptosporangiaceae bacterium]
MPRQEVSETAIIAAPATRVFALLTDPAQHPLIDGTGSVLAARDGGPERLTLGSKFGMDMKIGAPYKILNTVVEYDRDRLIAWRHFYGHRWRWQLRPLEDGPGGGRCEVTETFDWSTARFPWLITLSPFPRRNRRGIEGSLMRLARIATASGP